MGILVKQRLDPDNFLRKRAESSLLEAKSVSFNEAPCLLEKDYQDMVTPSRLMPDRERRSMALIRTVTSLRDHEGAMVAVGKFHKILAIFRLGT